MATSRAELESLARDLAEQSRIMVSLLRFDDSPVVKDVRDTVEELVKKVEAVCSEWRQEQVPDEELPCPTTLRGILADDESTDN